MIAFLAAGILLADASSDTRDVSQADVDAVMRAQAEKLDACFVAHSPAAPKGGVTARVVFTAAGYVTAMELTKNTASPAVGACVLAVLAQVKVPVGPEEFAVEVPIAVGPTLPPRKR